MAIDDTTKRILSYWLVTRIGLSVWAALCSTFVPLTELEKRGRTLAARRFDHKLAGPVDALAVGPLGC
ncbi:MAG: hypothetical protein IPM55_06900 [Acidobacteria bacterium]|nr:hypothetical protein [Acidobacteriota bacterium]